MATIEREWTTDMVMFYASANGGLSGECRREWPQSYLDTHIVPDGGLYPMDVDKARAVGSLLTQQWIERRERVVDVAEDTNSWSMFYRTPAHRLTLVTYYATESGRAAWTSKEPS